jgi:hypothetical protein
VGADAEAEGRTSLPGPTAAQHSQVSAASRALAASVAEGMPPPWPALVRSAATARDAELADRLDRAVAGAGAELEPRRPRWWAAAGLVQRTLAIAAGVGALWLLAVAGLGFLHLDDALPIPDVWGLPVPTLLLVGGLVAGLLVAGLARLVNGGGARRRARAATRSLHRRVEEVADELVIAPVEAELTAHDHLQEALAEAAGGGGSRWRLPARAARQAAELPG